VDNKNRKVAIIIPGGIGTGQNNIGVPVLEQIVKLLSKEFEITVFSLFKVNDNYKQNDFELISVTGSSSLIRIFKLFFILMGRHRRHRFDIVHGFWAMPSGFLATVFCKIFGQKSIVSILGGDAISLPEIGYGQLQHPFQRKLIMWTLTNANEVIALTKYLALNLRTFGLKRNIKIIPWGVDTTRFRFQAKTLHDPIQFLHIGNLSPVKDQVTLLKAFQIVSRQVSCKLTIIGEGILESKIKSLAEQLNIEDKISFVGVMPYHALPKYYQEADILLHTSLSEGQSEVVTEAMSTGVLVCGTQVGLLYDQPSCCIAVPVKDFEMLANEVLNLLRDPNRMSQIKSNAHEWASQHSILWTAQRIKEIYLARNDDQ
jgi:glycosyltransferase involved in cell wall biosynthesis